MDFLTFATQCGPDVHPLTTQAIVRAESGFDPLVIRNNTLGVTHRPRSLREAQLLVTRLHGQGHRLAVGLMQVSTPWFGRYRITPAALLDGCTNIRYGTLILATNYAAFRGRAATPEQTLAMALSAYWSGQPDRGGAYVNHVYRLAGSTVRVAVTAGVTDGLLGR